MTPLHKLCTAISSNLITRDCSLHPFPFLTDCYSLFLCLHFVGLSLLQILEWTQGKTVAFSSASFSSRLVRAVIRKWWSFSAACCPLSLSGHGCQYLHRQERQLRPLQAEEWKFLEKAQSHYPWTFPCPCARKIRFCIIWWMLQLQELLCRTHFSPKHLSTHCNLNGFVKDMSKGCN